MCRRLCCQYLAQEMERVSFAAPAACSVRLTCTAGLVGMSRACCCCPEDLHSQDCAPYSLHCAAQSPLAISSVPLLVLHYFVCCKPYVWFWGCCRALTWGSTRGGQHLPVLSTAGPALASHCWLGPLRFGCAVEAFETDLQLAGSGFARTAAGCVGAGQVMPARGGFSTPLHVNTQSTSQRWNEPAQRNNHFEIEEINTRSPKTFEGMIQVRPQPSAISTRRQHCSFRVKNTHLRHSPPFQNNSQ